jgi:cell division protein FtsI (penicillin-binding protein 3)/stage V sporulation protein D (sporulation-specific penicillin-binding protein)
LVSYRLVHIQLVEHDKYRLEAIENHCIRIEQPPRRGMIYDDAGQVLAQSQVLHDIRVDGRNLLDPAQTLGEIEKILGLPVGSLAKIFKSDNRYQLLAREATEEQVAALHDLEAAKIAQWRKQKRDTGRFLTIDDRYLRSYPNGIHASHLLGFLDDDNKGVAGVEGAMDRFMRGIPGEQWIEKDPRGREIAGYRGRDQEPVDGYNVVLTLDLSVQHILEDGLDKMVQKFHPAGICAIAMRPKTGEILGMANRPTYDPNNRKGVEMAAFRNRCLTDGFEPGSTFKIVTLSAALNEQITTLDSQIYCENGRFFYADHWLHDDEPRGMLSVEQILAFSSNIGFAKLGLELGDERLFQYATQFGFGHATGMLPRQGETAGLLRPVDKWSKLSATRVPMGQEVLATPIQMATAMSVIANRGNLVQPRIVQEITDSQGRVVEYFPPRVIRRVIGEATAKQVSMALADVVNEGTAAGKANIPGFSVAGKTGTAQKFINGEYSHTKFVASFIGFVPEEDPQFVLLIMVDEPQGRNYYGAQVAAPAFSEMGKQIADVLNMVPPSAPAELVPGVPVPPMAPMTPAPVVQRASL